MELSFEPIGDVPKDWVQAVKAYEPKRSAVVIYNDKFLGIVGEPSAKLRDSLKLPVQISMFELDITEMAKLASKASRYKPLNRYPSLSQDLCLKTATDMQFAETAGFLHSQLSKAEKTHGYSFRISPVDIFQRQEDKGHKQTTWRITLAHPERTLTTEETNRLLNKITSTAKTELGADRI